MGPKGRGVGDGKKLRVEIGDKLFSFKIKDIRFVLDEPNGGAIVQIGNKILGRVGRNDKAELKTYWDAKALMDWLEDKPKQSELSKLKLLVETMWEEIEALQQELKFLNPPPPNKGLFYLGPG